MPRQTLDSEQILGLLRDSTQDAGSVLGRIVRHASVEQIVRAFADTEDESTRKVLFEVLGSKQDRAAVPFLIRALQDPSPVVRSAAAEILGEFKEMSAAGPLQQAYRKEKDSDERCIFIGALGRTGAKNSIPLLIAALREQDERLRAFAAGALCDLDAEEAIPALREALAATREEGLIEDIGTSLLLLEKRQPLLSDRIIALLLEPVENRRPVMALIERRAPIEELSRAIGEAPDTFTRQLLCSIAGRRQESGAVPALVKALADDSSGVRYDAADALAKIGDRAAAEPLHRAFLEEKDQHARFMMAAALGAVGEAQAIPALIAALAEPDDMLIGGSAWSLGALDAKESIPALRRAQARTSDSYALERIRRALESLEEEL